MSIKFDSLGVGRLGKRKAPRVDPKYATLNRRMIAVTIDLLIILLIIAPVPGFLLDWSYHANAFDASLWQAKVAAAPSPSEAHQVFIQELHSPEDRRRLLTRSVLQTFILGTFTLLCWAKWSATPGKILLHMRIADATTEAPISRRQIILRLLGYFISTVFFCAGFFWIGVDKRRQGWHDKIAHTVVICKSKKEVSDQAL